MNTSLFFLATEKPGGLFDLDGTLPLMAIQFLGLMFLLNFLLYTPLLSVIYDRNQYINKNLASASNILAQSNKLIKQYENELVTTRKKGQQEITDLKRLHGEVLGLEAASAQSYLNQFSKESSKRLEEKTNEALNQLESKLQYFSKQILSNIFSQSLHN
jgi:F-type H+-transporting ATPase subunit b